MIERSRTARTLAGGVLLVSGFLSALVRRRVRPSRLRAVIRLSLEGVVDPFVADYLRERHRGRGRGRRRPPHDRHARRPRLLDARDHQGDRGIHDPGDLLRRAGGREGGLGGSVHPDGLPRRRDGPRDERRARPRPVGIGGVTLARKVEEDAAATMREARRAARAQRGPRRDVRDGVEEHHRPGGPRGEHHRPDRQLRARAPGAGRRRGRRGRGRRHR